MNEEGRGKKRKEDCKEDEGRGMDEENERVVPQYSPDISENCS